MRGTSSMPVLVISMLMSGSGFADELAQPKLTPATEAFLADLEQSSRWQPPGHLQPIRYTDNFIRPLSDLEFTDGGFLTRVSRLRRVSFLTFAEIGQSQLFFGVNNKGLLGLHFNAYKNRGKERQLELLRMPYLLDIDQESQ